MPGIPGVPADLSSYATKKDLETKIDKNGETDSLQLNEGIVIRSREESGYVQLKVFGTEDDENETLTLDSSLGTDLRISGVYKVVGDYDVANKSYVDNAIHTALSDIIFAEDLTF